MNTTLKNLIRLDELTRRCENEDSTIELERKMDWLRTRLPNAVLGRFDHLIQRGRLAVAQVSESGACGSCHLKLTPADAVRFRRASEDTILTCPYCGCFLYAVTAVPAEEKPTIVAL
jgi:predicted  nucleic acid-binding Zn-ribbon protein